MTTGKALLGVMAGMAAGVAIGMLFAPEKGSAIRQKISSKGEDLAEALNDKIDEKFNDLMAAVTGKVKSTARKQTQEYNQTEPV